MNRILTSAFQNELEKMAVSGEYAADALHSRLSRLNPLFQWPGKAAREARALKIIRIVA